MNNLNELTLKRAFYWLTNQRERPPMYLKIWGFLAICSFALFAISQMAETSNISLWLAMALALSILWSILSLAYLLWVIKRGLVFVRFKKTSQVKDKPFEVPLIASDHEIKP